LDWTLRVYKENPREPVSRLLMGLGNQLPFCVIDPF
jgi:hypothetical protein